MLNFINKNKIIILIFSITLFLGILTFLTFIDRSFIKLNDANLQNLLIIDLVVIIIFFILIFIEITKIIKSNSNKEKSSKANLRYITFFSLATLLPSILIAAFSLSLFYFALEKYLDKKVSIAVNNSYDMAKNYLEDIRNNIDADIVLISFDINRNVKLFYENKLEFNNLLINVDLPTLGFPIKQSLIFFSFNIFFYLYANKFPFVVRKKIVLFDTIA